MIKSRLLPMLKFLWKWAQKQVFHNYDISHLIKFINVLLFSGFFGLAKYFKTIHLQNLR